MRVGVSPIISSMTTSGVWQLTQTLICRNVRIPLVVANRTQGVTLRPGGMS